MMATTTEPKKEKLIAKSQGTAIKEFRKKKKLSQKDLADAASTTRQYICRIEKGAHNVTPKIAKGLRKLGMTKKSIVEAYTKDSAKNFASKI